MKGVLEKAAVEGSIPSRRMAYVTKERIIHAKYNDSYIVYE
jgi:hypothetical protein